MKFFRVGDPSKPLVLFLHGFMGSHYDWFEITQSLSKKYSCLLLDLPGHGVNPFEKISIQSFNDLSFSILGHIKKITTRPCFLLGYSLGGRIALDLLSKDPDQFEKVIVESCHPGLESDFLKKERIKSDEGLLSHIHSQNDFNNFLLKWYNLELFGDISKKENFHKLLTRREKNSLKEIKKSLQNFSLGRQDNLIPLFKKNQTPLLYISGERDKKYTQIGKDFIDKVPNSYHKSINDVSHNTHFEDPNSFEKAVTLFLERGFTF
ncbi:2-succinyl-6-hydroxy-2,4-cyclohexadiene-1-carboxylate synthase [Bacteriovoracales bacterium]|nr:2-succinyl-6-hydroxy-2,4-cyclohexadiene-1-carboxylate synthase [Bacteriovoracales bacterium]